MDYLTMNDVTTRKLKIPELLDVLSDENARPYWRAVASQL